MSTDHTTQTVLFNSLFDKPVVAKFDQAHSSSDGGLVLVQAADQKLGLSDRISAALQDWRDSSRVHHTLKELIQQRVYGIASGYPDGNDAATLKDDPMQKVASFHGYYDSYCYLPLVATMSLDEDPEQYLLGAMLRPGNATAHLGFEAVMRRLLPRLRERSPKATICVRLDGGFAAPEVLDFLEAERLE